MGAAAMVVFDIDGVLREVTQSYRLAIADTVEQFTQHQYRPTLMEIDQLKTEGIWNNDWEASQELIYRYWESQGQYREALGLNYSELVEFFQGRYRGTDWNGYITSETLLVSRPYLDTLTQNQILWGFFSGAMRDEAKYALEYRLGLSNLALVAMEDAPGKPNPTGLFQVVEQLDPHPEIPVFYLGDTVADMRTVAEAKREQPQRQWWAIGILPPHVQTCAERMATYGEQLRNAGAYKVFKNVEEFTLGEIEAVIGKDHPL